MTAAGAAVDRADSGVGGEAGLAGGVGGVGEGEAQPPKMQKGEG